MSFWNTRREERHMERLEEHAAMSTCFAAGYAKARQDHEEKQANETPTNRQSP